MNLLRTHDVATGHERFFLDGRRVRRDVYMEELQAAIMSGRYSASHTVKPLGSTVYRHHACA